MDLSNIPDLGSRQLLAVLAIADYGSFIAAGAGIAAAISPFSLMFSVTASLGITFFSFSPTLTSFQWRSRSWRFLPAAFGLLFQASGLGK